MDKAKPNETNVSIRERLKMTTLYDDIIVDSPKNFMKLISKKSIY